MRLTALAAASLLASACDASPLHPFTSEVVKRQEPGPGSYYPITGATGGVHPRLEIRELEKTGQMWNLFLLAMKGFQETDQSDIDSWYSVAGIHGMPWRSWDGVEGTTEDRGESERGYCPHNNLLFGTWHRPYLLLFEVAKQIASQFPTSLRGAYEEAANKLRIPYWDWAYNVTAEQEVIPNSMTISNIQVTFPNGTLGEIHNPLFEYRFNPKPAEINGTGCTTVGGPGGARGGDPDICNTYTYTARRPNKATNASDHTGLNRALFDIKKSQRRTLYTLLSQWQDFDRFSNDGFCGQSRRVGSLEVLHNPIHTSNFPGHMSPASVSAFDPMFWFHHANVDRQMALFQAIFPDTYIADGGACPADTPTYTINEGEPLDNNSPLTPFHRNTEGEFWTSAHVRNIEDLGYTYPELIGRPDNSTLKANIKHQYDDSLPTTVTKRQDQAEPAKGLVYLAEVKLALYGFTDGNGSSQPYNVLTFLGDVPSEPTEWLQAESFVAITSATGGHRMTKNLSSTMLVDLTDALAKAGKKPDKAAVEFLKENLHWRLGLGDFEIKRAEIPGVEVKLLSTEVEFSNRDDDFDHWVGDFTDYGLVDA